MCGVKPDLLPCAGAGCAAGFEACTGCVSGAGFEALSFAKVSTAIRVTVVGASLPHVSQPPEVPTTSGFIISESDFTFAISFFYDESEEYEFLGFIDRIRS